MSEQAFAVRALWLLHSFARRESALNREQTLPTSGAANQGMKLSRLWSPILTKPDEKFSTAFLSALETCAGEILEDYPFVSEATSEPTPALTELFPMIGIALGILPQGGKVVDKGLALKKMRGAFVHKKPALKKLRGAFIHWLRGDQNVHLTLNPTLHQWRREAKRELAYFFCHLAYQMAQTTDLGLDPEVRERDLAALSGALDKMGLHPQKEGSSLVVHLNSPKRAVSILFEIGHHPEERIEYQRHNQLRFIDATYYPMSVRLRIVNDRSEPLKLSGKKERLRKRETTWSETEETHVVRVIVEHNAIQKGRVRAAALHELAEVALVLSRKPAGRDIAHDGAQEFSAEWVEGVSEEVVLELLNGKHNLPVIQPRPLPLVGSAAKKALSVLKPYLPLFIVGYLTFAASVPGKAQTNSSLSQEVAQPPLPLDSEASIKYLQGTDEESSRIAAFIARLSRPSQNISFRDAQAFCDDRARFVPRPASASRHSSCGHRSARNYRGSKCLRSIACGRSRCGAQRNARTNGFLPRGASLESFYGTQAAAKINFGADLYSASWRALGELGCAPWTPLKDRQAIVDAATKLMSSAPKERHDKFAPEFRDLFENFGPAAIDPLLQAASRPRADIAAIGWALSMVKESTSVLLARRERRSEKETSSVLDGSSSA